MKFIQKYENFTTDDNRGDNQSFPKYNQANRLKAKQYVDQIFSGGSGPEVVEMCKEIGCDRPTNDEELESVKEKALEYFIDNPERIKEVGTSFQSYPYSGNGNDGIVRTNNVGGVVRESKGEKNSKVILNDDEMNLFSSETPLINLIRKNKISLHDKEVWYAKDDKETKKILDIFFEIDSVNESYNYPTMEQVEDASPGEIMRWQRFLPSPSNKEQSDIINAVFAKYKKLKASGDINSDTSKSVGWNESTNNFRISVLSLRRESDGMIFKIGDKYKDGNNNEFTIASITSGGQDIFYLNAEEGGFINVLNAIKS